jgi:serine/threonine protein kinase
MLFEIAFIDCRIIIVLKCSVFTEVRDLISQLLSPKPTERPTFSEILEHPWLNMDSDSSSSSLDIPIDGRVLQDSGSSSVGSV